MMNMRLIPGKRIDNGEWDMALLFQTHLKKHMATIVTWALFGGTIRKPEDGEIGLPATVGQFTGLAGHCQDRGISGRAGEIRG